jgi:hypothetical protein
MAANPIDCQRLRLVVGVYICLLLPLSGHTQQARVANRYSPPELQASDQDIKKMLASAEAKSDSGEYDAAFADANAALELAKKKGLVGDRAITG